MGAYHTMARCPGGMKRCPLPWKLWWCFCGYSCSIGTFRDWSSKDMGQSSDPALASIKPEISQAMNSLLEEIRSSEETRVMRMAMSDSQFH